MTRRWVSVVILALLTQPIFLFGQSSGTNDWARINALTTGGKIRVETKNGSGFDGKLASASATSISLSRNGKTETFDHVDVRRVYRVEGGSPAKSIAIGTGIGAGVGGGLGGGLLAATGGSDETGKVLAPFIIVGAAVGAALGAVFGRKKRTLIYESK